MLCHKCTFRCMIKEGMHQTKIRNESTKETEIKDTALILGSGIENIFTFGAVNFNGTGAWDV